MNDIHDIGEAELRLALRGLRRDIEPSRDLWPGIEARLPPQRPVARPARIWPWALAASMTLALGLAWQGSGPVAPRPVPVATPVAAAQPITNEADALTLHYEAALRELDVGSVPASWQAGLEALDQSAALVQAALRQHPDSPQLLEQLRQLYARRIALSRRALFT